MLEVGPTYTDFDDDGFRDDDATENVKPHSRIHVFCGVVAYVASREYVTVEGWRG